MCDEEETAESHPQSFRDQVAKVAPWVLEIEPVPVIARFTLIGALAYVANWVAGFNRFYLGIFVVLWLWGRRSTLNFGTIHGSSKWAGEASLKKEGLLGKRDGLLLGRFKETDHGFWHALKKLCTAPLAQSDSVVRHFLTAITKKHVDLHEGDQGVMICAPQGKYVHVLTVAPAGAGKGVGAVIPNLLNYRHSVIVIDVKGENYSKTAHVRKAWGQNVVALNPFGVKDCDTGEVIPTASLNPLDLIDSESSTLIEDLRMLADALVIRSGSDKDPHWNESAVSLLHAILLYVSSSEDPEVRHLTCMKGIASNKEDLDTCFSNMRELWGTSPRGDILAGIAASLQAIPEKEFGSILSTTNRHTAFLNSELIIPNVATTSWDVRSIATSPTSVYLILPAQYLQSHANLIRLWINSLLLVVKQAGVGEQNELLFILDEVAALGEMRQLEEAVTLLRGFGLRTWWIVQSINMLETSYPGPRAKTLLGNFGIQQYFGISDIETATVVAKMIGKTTTIAPNVSRGWSSSQGGGQNSSASRGRSGNVSHNSFERDLIKPEEILREEPDTVFIIRQGRFPILAKRLTYWADAQLSPDAARKPRLVSYASYALSALGIIAALYWVQGSMEFPSRANVQVSPASRSTATSPNPEQQDQRVRRSTKHPLSPEPEEPQTIEVLCPHCKNQAPVPIAYAGHSIRCRNCQAELDIPNLHEEDIP